MQKITIVSDKLDETEVRRLQEITDKFVKQLHYKAHAIQHLLGSYYELSVSIISVSQEEIQLNCRPYKLNGE